MLTVLRSAKRETMPCCRLLSNIFQFEQAVIGIHPSRIGHEFLPGFNRSRAGKRIDNDFLVCLIRRILGTDLLARLLNVMASISLFGSRVPGVFLPRKIGYCLKSCSIIFGQVLSGRNAICGIHLRMPVDVSFNVIHELAGRHIGSPAIVSNRLRISYDRAGVGARVCMKESRRTAYPMLMRKIDFPGLRLASEVFGESG